MSTKVLVVDDESDFVQLMVYNLTRAGFEAVSALNGLTAIQLAQRHIPDVVLLDVMMPELDGFSVCEVLGRNAATSRIPVILLTALDGMAARTRGMEAGAVQHLVKPVELPLLLATIQGVVTRHRELFSRRED